MTRLAKSTAPILAILGFSLCLPGKLSAQAAPATQPQKPVPAQAAKPATTTAAAPAKPLPAAQSGHVPAVVPGKPAAKPVPAPATAAKPATAVTATKPAAAKPVTAQPAAVKPATAPKPVAAKPMVVKPAAKPTAPAKMAAAPAAAKPREERAEKKSVEMKPDAKAAAKADAGPEAVDTLVAKRDPFVSPLATRTSAGGPLLPPGKAGLVVATVRIDGTVKSGDGMIAMVSNPEKHVYFVREGDRLYDGDVETISLDGVTFRENSKDAFGKPVERMVTKRVYQSAGESQ